MRNTLKEKIIPLAFTVVTFLALWIFLYGFILILNTFPLKEKIGLGIRKQDILVGLAIYVKTSIDFAIFIGNLMKTNPGWKKRISIEFGTAVGNAMGTLVILTVWTFFKEVPLLMAGMIFLASIVLLKMAQESLEEFFRVKNNNFLKTFNTLFSPLLSKIIPHTSLTKIKPLSFMPLALFSFTIPFILGLDDFAGYIPLFSIINVYGFAIGVFLGHMLLNIALFVSPEKTVTAVRTPFILLGGGIAFIGISLYGFFEVLKLIFNLL